MSDLKKRIDAINENNKNITYEITGSKNQDILTLRDHFAGLAMQGLATQENWVSLDHIAANAYQLADAMLAARNNKTVIGNE